MKQVPKFIAREFLYGGHLQSIGAAAIVCMATRIFHLPIAGNLLLSVYLLFQSIYYFDRYRDIDIDTSTNQERVGHMRAYKTYIPAIVFVMLACATWLLMRAQAISVMAISVLIAIFGLLYPVFFKNLTTRLPLFKNVYVATVFSMLIFFPLFYYQQQIVVDYTLIVFFIFVLGESLITQFMLDYKDRESDQQRKLLTLPVLVSERQSRHYVFTASVVLAVSTLIIVRVLDIPALGAIAFATLIFNLVVMQLITSHKHIAFIVAAAKYWLWPIVLFIFS